ncbi:hypothetical protein [Fibrobacter sp. UWH9]|uniref:hypothetical protein n=1 Tax=Fibrobacter sp. UWH9 TaxID=1896213 RepID=UPI0015873B56|nr:hypothetical protein [Fibrobacter sp. UWH9]
MTAEKGKSTDQVPLKLVTVKRSRFSHVRLDDPETWPLVAQFFLRHHQHVWKHLGSLAR